MSYEVKFFDSSDIDDMPEELKEYFEGPYCDDRTVLAIIEDGELKDYHFDGGESEDNSFGRDWNWVPEALENAYKKGLADGYTEMTGNKT